MASKIPGSTNVALRIVMAMTRCDAWRAGNLDGVDVLFCSVDDVLPCLLAVVDDVQRAMIDGKE